MNSVPKTLNKPPAAKTVVEGNKSTTKFLPGVIPIQLEKNKEQINSIGNNLESYTKTISTGSAIQFKKGNSLGNDSNTIQKKAAPKWSFQPNIIPSSSNYPIQKKAAPSNKTGLPDNVKLGVEQLSGLSSSDVKVHFNSSKPTQLQAQGTDIHVGPRQEKHVVQQKQGRVNATIQMKNKVAINDDAVLEKEADVMGANAIQLTAKEYDPSINNKTFSNNPIVQRNIFKSAINWVGDKLNSITGSKPKQEDTAKKSETTVVAKPSKDESLKQNEVPVGPQKKEVDKVALKKEHEKIKIQIKEFIDSFNKNKSLALENVIKHESFDIIFQSTLKELNAAKEKIPKGRFEKLKLKFEETKSDKLAPLFNIGIINSAQKRFDDAIENSKIEKVLVQNAIEDATTIDTNETLDETLDIALIEKTLAKVKEHKRIAENCNKVAIEGFKKIKIQSNEKVQASKIINRVKNNIDQIAKEDYEEFKKIKNDTQIAKEKNSRWLPFGEKLTDYDKSLLGKDKKEVKVAEKDPELNEEQKDQISKERHKGYTNNFTRTIGFKTTTEKEIEKTNKQERAKKSVKESGLDDLLMPSDYDHTGNKEKAKEIANKEREKKEDEKKKIQEEKKLKQKEWDSKSKWKKTSHMFGKAWAGTTSAIGSGLSGIFKGTVALGGGILNGVSAIGTGMYKGVAAVGSGIYNGGAAIGKGYRKLRNKETDADKQADEKALKSKEDEKENLLKTEYALSGNLGHVDSEERIESKQFVEKSPKIIGNLNWEAMKIPSKYSEISTKENRKGITDDIKGIVKPIAENTRAQQQLGLGALNVRKGKDVIKNNDKASIVDDKKSEEEKQKSLAENIKNEEETYLPLFLEMFAVYKIFDDLKNMYENKKGKNAQNSAEVVKQITNAAINGLKVSQKIFHCTGSSNNILIPALGTIIALANFSKSYFTRVLAIESGKKMEEMVNHGFDDLPFTNEKIFKQENRGALTQYQNFNRIQPKVLEDFDTILQQRLIPIEEFNKTYGTSAQVNNLQDLKKFISRLRGYELISKLHEINLKRNAHSNVNLFADTAILGAKISELIPGGHFAAGVFYTIGGGTKAITKAAVSINKFNKNQNGNAEENLDRTKFESIAGIFKQSPIKHAEYVNHAFKIIEMYSSILPNLHDDEKFEKNINTVEGIVIAAGAYPPAVYKSAEETISGFNAVDKLIEGLKSGR